MSLVSSFGQGCWRSIGSKVLCLAPNGSSDWKLFCECSTDLLKTYIDGVSRLAGRLKTKEAPSTTAASTYEPRLDAPDQDEQDDPQICSGAELNGDNLPYPLAKAPTTHSNDLC